MLANRSLGTPFSNLKVSILFLVMQPDIASEKAPPMTELVCVTTWHFQREIRVPQDDVNLIVSDEQPIAAYATFRDYSIFNKKRLIARDVQGLPGGQGGRGVFVTIFIDQHLVIKECGLNVGLHRRA